MICFPLNVSNIFTTLHPYISSLFILPFIIEIVLNLNLQYFQHGECISDKLSIIQNYLKFNFWVDIVGVIGSVAINEDSYFELMLAVFFIRFMKFQNMYVAIEEKFQLSLRFTTIYTLLNIFLSISILAHVCGCIFQMIGISLHE